MAPRAGRARRSRVSAATKATARTAAHTGPSSLAPDSAACGNRGLQRTLEEVRQDREAVLLGDKHGSVRRTSSSDERSRSGSPAGGSLCAGAAVAGRRERRAARRRCLKPAGVQRAGVCAAVCRGPCTDVRRPVLHRLLRRGAGRAGGTRAHLFASAGRRDSACIGGRCGPLASREHPVAAGS
eukprot:298198-Prymnesium_polylepis.2